MKLVVRRTVLAAAVGTLVLVWVAARASAQRRSSLPIMRLYTGPDGQSRAEEIEVNLYPSNLRAGLDQSTPVRVSGAQFVRWPRGHTWGWHTATQPQYVITISGYGEVELAGSRKISLNPGRVLLAEDVTGKGHITRVVGSQDLVLLLVPLAER